MICEIIRGIACFARMMEKAQKFTEDKEFACDALPCFRDRDDDDDKEDD
jgi:hypothetical protein